MSDTKALGRIPLLLAAIGLLTLACAFGAQQVEPTATVPTMPPGPTNTPVSFMPEPTEAPTEDPGECEPPTPQISIGEPVEGQVPTAGDQPEIRVYYCVMIPEETSRAIFELTGTTAPLDLFVGYPDLETVQNGGILFWADMTGEEGDKRVVAELVREYIYAGPYYIEVSPTDSNNQSAYSLLVTIEQP